MYGHLLLVIEQGITKLYGTKTWEDIKKKSNLKGEIKDSEKYDKIDFEQLLKTSANLCGVKYDFLLSQLGDCYIDKLQVSGNYTLVRLLGRSITEFIQNIDFAHTVALAKYPDADIPLFRLEYDEYSTPDRFKVHYFSKKKNTTKFVESVIRTIGRIFFKKKIDLEIIENDTRDLRNHICYSVSVSDIPEETDAPPTLIAQTRRNAEQQIEHKNIEEQKEKIDFIRREYGEAALPVQRERVAKAKWKTAMRMNLLYKKLNPTIPRTLSIGPKDFCEVFPYHIVFDKEMQLKQCGVHIQNIIPDFRKEATVITKHLELIHPKHKNFSFSNVEDTRDCPHIVMVVNNSLVPAGKNKDKLYFRGEMIKLAESNLMLYLCSPLTSQLSHVDVQSMRLSEMRNHDATKYFVAFSAMSKGDWVDMFLGKTKDDQNGDKDGHGDDDKNKSKEQPDSKDQNGSTHPYIGGAVLNNNNYSPYGGGMTSIVQKVVRDGKKYKNCTVLFCDIVKFSTLVDSCSPSDLINMLNQLHDSFDRLIQVHGVDRIDVVGDAYLVVAGIPNSTSRCPERLGNCALGMLLLSRSIPSPHDYGKPYGKRCLVRIGMHYGDLVGGIVGSHTPRFTVMGDAVVTASRMESHGVADEVHMSSIAFREMSSFNFELEERGMIEVRGKGRQFTYLLKKNTDLSNADLLGQTNRTLYAGDK